jgi:hypothetical protein
VVSFQEVFSQKFSYRPVVVLNIRQMSIIVIIFIITGKVQVLLAQMKVNFTLWPYSLSGKVPRGEQGEYGGGGGGDNAFKCTAVVLPVSWFILVVGKYT